MTIEEVLAYIEGLPPFIPRKVARGDLLFNLDTISELLDRLGNPQDSLRCIHVAGTNGKGSVSTYIASVLQEGGIKTGLYTSPYLSCVKEQIVIDGQEIGDNSFADIMSDIISVSEEMKSEGLQAPSEFEMVTAAAFLAFLKAECDICIVEVGMGGEWDATNVIKKPVLCVITDIGFDHTAVLGETLEKIASVKAGIIKPGCKVLVIRQNEEVLSAIKKKADSCDAKYYICNEPVNVTADDNGVTFLTGKIYEEKNGVSSVCDIDFGKKSYRLETGGVFQARNASLALAAIELLKKDNGLGLSHMDNECVQEGLKKVRRAARFEVLYTDPVFIADGCHNSAGILMLAESLSMLYGDKKIIFIAGVLADKDFEKMCEPLLHRMKCVFTVAPDNPRALPAKDLAELFKNCGVDSSECGDVFEAVDRALETAKEGDVICAFGSLYYMGTLRKYILSKA